MLILSEQAGLQVKLLGHSPSHYDIRIITPGNRAKLAYRASWRIPEAFAAGVGIPMSGRLECVEKVPADAPGLGMDSMVIGGSGLDHAAPVHFYVEALHWTETIAGKVVEVRNSSLKANKGPGTVVIKASVSVTSFSEVRTDFTYTWVTGPIPKQVPIIGVDAPPAAMGATSTPAPPAALQPVFSTANDGGVSNGGRSPSFTLSQATTIAYIMTYHWNGGAGAPGGTIALLSEDGTLYGPWPVTVSNKVYWEVRPNLLLPPGKYTLIDSSPGTWAQNGGSKGFGHVVIKSR